MTVARPSTSSASSWAPTTLDLPVEQIDRLYLNFINLRTAKFLGLTIPRSVLAQADEVVESMRARSG
jgi:hypothetical protein